MNFRKLHRQLSPWIFVVLVVSVLTGVGYRVGRAWFGMEREMGGWLMDLHTGEWLGSAVSPFYLLLPGLGLLFVAVSGFAVLLQRRSHLRLRLWHRILGAVLLLPLTVTALTGLAYKLGHAWFGWGKGDGDWLMTLHEGAWLGKDARAYYVLVTGGGLLALGLLGLAIARRKPAGVRPTAAGG